MAGTFIAPLAGAIVHEATQRGAPLEELLAALGVTALQLRDEERRIDGERVFAAWEIAMRATRDDGLPVSVSKHASIERYGVLGFALYTAATAADAIRCLVRYHDLINTTGKWQFIESPAHATITWERPDHSLGLRVANEQVLASFIGVSAEVFGAERPIGQVLVAHAPPPDTSAHEDHFGDRIRWNAPHNAIVLDREALQLRARGANSSMSMYFTKTAAAALEKVAPSSTWSARVAEEIANRLASGLPTLDVVAKALGTSERTARRRLSEESTSFAALTERVQRARADELLEGSLSARDVAFATGFSDVSAFSRAYRRWTGHPPSKNRSSRPPPSR